MKTTIITGVNGQDGSYLAELLLEKNHKVIGIDRWNPTGQYPNMKKFIDNPNFKLETGDITEKEFIARIIRDNKPDYFYNLAAISLVPESFKIPITVFETNALAVLYQLEAIRTYSPDTRYYQASTSEMIGENTEKLQNTDSRMLPNSPYAISKLASHHLVRCYRKAFGIFACNGMLWNHESPRRGQTFVTRKVSLHVAKHLDEVLQIGNLDSYRDWGHAKDFVEAMIMILEANEPDDYAVNTGESHSIRELIEEAYKVLDLHITWKGKGVEEKGYDQNNTLRIEVNKDFYRPVEVPFLNGDHSKIKENLGWTPKIKFKELVKIMIESDLYED